MRDKISRCCQLLLLVMNLCSLSPLNAATPVVPEKDPPLEEPPVRLRPEVANVHPRLLFGPEDLPRLRANYQHPSMKIYREALLGYLSAARGLPQQFTFLRCNRRTKARSLAHPHTCLPLLNDGR